MAVSQIGTAMFHSFLRNNAKLSLFSFLKTGSTALAVLTSATSGFAQDQIVHRSAKGQTGKDIRIGVYLNVQPDCSSGTLPSIRLLTPPSNGIATVKRAKIALTNYKNCMALEVPAFVAIYRSKANFVGTDAVTVVVSYTNGRSETQRIGITVASETPARNI